MNTPLELAVDIGRIVIEAQACRLSLDVSACADELMARFPQTGLQHRHVVAALREEACAVGLSMH
jgi:hypothetical protein